MEGRIDLLAPTDKTIVNLCTIAPAQGELYRRVWCIILQMIAEAKAELIELDEGSPRRTAEGESSLTIRLGQ
ncbi:MAG TPA: hypothetical protein VHB98_14330 [Chloroflexota bacterium]|nr:hypothetical protein [Chloroflexota bacterium]